jgi:hypothetical protein
VQLTMPKGAVKKSILKVEQQRCRRHDFKLAEGVLAFGW